MVIREEIYTVNTEKKERQKIMEVVEGENIRQASAFGRV